MPADSVARAAGLDRALAQWRRVLPEGAVVVGEGLIRYERNTLGAERRVEAALQPTRETEVVEAVKIANACRVPLYPISTGHNWGYGCATPVTDGCVVLDLSAMNEIVALDSDLGLVTVQPGVTQQQLWDALQEQRSPFMVPTTGAGPSASLLGNALERGYGITPFCDHFAAVTSLHAVLPSGDLYRSALSRSGGTLVDPVHKWGVGPYLDGLFSQSALGIVTEMTIALARRPARVEAFFFELSDDAYLDEAVEAVRELLQRAPGVLGGINLLNRLRVLSMLVPYPHDLVAPEAAIAEEIVLALGKQHRIPPWLGMGGIYGEPEMAAAARSLVKRHLKPLTRRIVFMSEARLRILRGAAKWVPGRVGEALQSRVSKLGEALDILSGQPRETALRLAYWRSRALPPTDRRLDPGRDACGLIWFAPLVPMKSREVRSFVTMATSVCRQLGIDPLVTLTSVSDRCFDSTIPILFDRASQHRRAAACYEALLAGARDLGFAPYRLNIASMGNGGVEPSERSLGAVIKDTLDPAGIIAPGRYA